MATSAGEVEVTLTLKQTDFNRMLAQSQQQLQDFGEKSSNFISDNSVAITAALAAIVEFAKGAIEAYTEQETATNRLVKAMESQGIASQATVSHMQDMARSLEQLTGVQDNVITSAQAMLTTFGLQGPVLDQALKAALDLSAGMGIDLNSAVMMLGKAFEGHLTILQRYGIQVNKNIDPTKRFSTVLGEVETRFGGQAAAQAATFGGQITLLGDAFEHVQEEAGKFIAGAGAGIVPWLTQMMKTLADSISVINEARQGMSSIFEFIGTYALSAIGALILSILKAIDAVRQFIVVGIGQLLINLPGISNLLKLMGVNVQQLTAAFPALVAAMDPIHRALTATSQGIEDTIVKWQASIIQEKQATNAVVSNENDKVTAYQNTYTQYVAILDQQGTYVKDKLAEEVKMRSDQAATLLKAQQEFVKSFSTSEADMWNEVNSLAQNFMDGFAKGFALMIVEGKNFSEAMKALFADMATEIIEWIIKMIVKMLIYLALREAAESFGGVGVAISNAMALVSNSGLTGMASGGMITEPSVVTGLVTGRQNLVGEAGPEAVMPQNTIPQGQGGAGGGITINISGQLIEGDAQSWQRLVTDKIVPAIRRFTMSTPTGPFTRRRGVA